MHYTLTTLSTLAFTASAFVLPVPPQTTHVAQLKRASNGTASSGSLPASSGTSVLSAVQTIAAGESFDGGMVMFDRGVSCTGQAEGGDSDAVFQIEEGGSLSNVIIGPNQIEGVHCQGACTLTNVWWSAVCEDAFTIKNQDAGATTTITGGGAYGADDKVLQHNGAGTLKVSDFTVSDFGKLYRSCGNCDDMYERHVEMSGVSATSGSELCGINANYGDTCTLSDITASGVEDICVTYTGNDTGDEPEESGSGPDGTNCIYAASDISES
ncbi:pectate lyase precursor [Xylariaceae sp. FL0016]|nr:pectate lyase precursor [Xylariaceae sp. FL0016]